MRGAAVELRDLGKVMHQLSSAEAAPQVIQKVVDGVNRGQIVKLHQVRLSVLLRGTSKCDLRILTAARLQAPQVRTDCSVKNGSQMSNFGDWLRTGISAGRMLRLAGHRPFSSTSHAGGRGRFLRLLMS